MNCTEAQVLLAAHRDLKNEQIDTTELDVHLEQCASCRQVLAQYSLIGKQVRTLPSLEPAPDMYAKLMRSLASEHTQSLQRSPSSTVPVPEFLKPYLREHATATQKTDSLAAFSTADTGPLPVIRPIRKKPHRPRMGQFTIIGLAAAFLMVFMMGGITGLLILAQGHLQTGQIAYNISNPTNIVSLQYTTSTPFQHVVSAVANNNEVYYTAFGDSTSNNWMLEQLDRKTNISTPLLSTPSASPLIVLGSDNNWLVWLQFDQPNPAGQGKLIQPSKQTQLRTWSLHYLSLAPQQSATGSSGSPGIPETLLSGVFDQDTVPSWVHTPVQGLRILNDMLLVATTDQKGTSHLLSYTLSENSKPTATVIATASANHVFTSPTATTDGNQIFWADEWRTSDSTLHSNIWTQQTYTAPATYGQAIRHTDTIQQVFLSGGMAFHPVIANDTLFLLSTANLTNTSPTTAATATTSTPSVVATPNTLVPTATWADASTYQVQLEDAVVGSLIMYPLDGDPNNLPSQIAIDATSLQAGTTFVLWQTKDGYDMYNAVTRSFVTTNDVLSGAQFLAVNGSSAVWIENNAIDNSGNSTVTLMAFNWPRPVA